MPKRTYQTMSGRAQGRRGRRAPTALAPRYLANRGLRFGGYRRSFRRGPLGRMEKKYIDVATASYACDTTGTVTLMGPYAQGAGISQRIGDSIILKSIEFRGYLANNSTAILNFDRAMIIWDKQPNKALAAITDILSVGNTFGFNVDQNKRRFKTIKHIHEVTLGNTATPATGKESIDCSFYQKLNHKMEFAQAGTGSIGDITTGALLLVTIGNNVPGTTAAILNGSFRIRYIDP